MNPSTIPMRRRLYAVRDDKMQQFDQIVGIGNDAVAARSFGDLVSQDKGQFSKHPADFSLWYLGDFDLESGAFLTNEAAHIVCRASDFALEKKDVPAS